MKFVAVAAVAMAALASAQNRNEIPSCALPCLDDSVKKVTSCSTSDFACICKKENFSKVQGDATSCVISKCGADKAVSEVLPATQKLCDEAAKGGNSAPASQSSEKPTETQAPTGKPTETAMPTESAPATTDCPTTMTSAPSPTGNGTAPATSAPVTAGAAGFAPIGGLAMLAIGALAL
ncbi:extracellular membrane protein, CFEM domain-containing protein [Pochonia chlamydosporia 170]|uniref:Extracellular membrane protein, CFEM domain-containing protein n=1 Tax=Pochonia chlamydosporia 170 TaxID=1380566 RepID=A0A179FMI5_METCM|nr:extracellular membrane protein, CFEM domain-containing protein [Pochonia chlamydosporia 170]OAQ66283.1 extracellular membrane protein, CFEM domain-containing protein [Pochonia chlamydosporia 170]